MNSASRSLFVAPVVFLTGLPLDEAPREAGDSAERAEGTRSPFPASARELSAGCYSVSIFGSGAEYAG